MNAELCNAMKDGTASLLNFSRDKLVNELDLAAAMESGKVAKYVTDFPNDNMVGRENVILLRHLGASTAEAEDDSCAVMAVDEIRSYFENGNIINSVNFPRLDMGETWKRHPCCCDDQRCCRSCAFRDGNAFGRLTKIKYSRVMASRREDGISYVLAEITQESIPSLLFYGEEGGRDHQLPCNRKMTEKSSKGTVALTENIQPSGHSPFCIGFASHGSVLFTRPEIAFTRRRLLQKGDSCI